jgi:Bacterial membrane protein YfhO
LFVLGMLILKDNLKWYLLAATILAIMLSWGKNFMGLTNFFMDYLPGYNKFRAVSMTLVIAEFTMPLIAILGVREIVLNPGILKEKRNSFYIALAATAGLCLLFYIMPTTFQDFYKNGEYESVGAQLKKSGAAAEQIQQFMSGMETARIAIFKADAMRSFLFIVLGAGLLFIYSLKAFNKNYLYAGLGLLILIDLWAVDKRYLNDKNYVSKSSMETPYMPSPADEQILKDTDPHYRVMNVSLSPFQDATTSYFHKSIGGYHGAKLRRYQDLYERQISKNNMQVLNMLNAKYFIMQNQQNGELMAQRNPSAMGNAWFVKELKWVANPDSELNALTNFNPAVTAVVDKKWEKDLPAAAFQFDSTATIKLKSYKADELVYEAQAATPQMTVFSEIYYPKGWNAYVDGKLTPHLGVNYVLRAMVLPAGKHEVVFKFEPEAYYKGEKIAMAGSILLFLFVIGGVYMQMRSNKEAE